MDTNSNIKAIEVNNLPVTNSMDVANNLVTPVTDCSFVVNSDVNVANGSSGSTDSLATTTTTKTGRGQVFSNVYKLCAVW